MGNATIDQVSASLGRCSATGERIARPVKSVMNDESAGASVVSGGLGTENAVASTLRLRIRRSRIDLEILDYTVLYDVLFEDQHSFEVAYT